MHISTAFPLLNQGSLAGPQDDGVFESVILSTHQLMSRLKPTLASAQLISCAHRLMNKARLINVFSESDRVHLLQIFCAFTQPFTESEAKGLIEWYKVVKEELGEEIFSLVTNPSCYAGSSHAEVMKLLQHLVEINSCIDDVTPDLIQCYQNQIGLKELLQRIATLKSKIEAQKYPEKDLEEVMHAFSSTEEGSLVAIPLSIDQLAEIKAEYLQIVEMGAELKEGGINQLIGFVGEFKNRAKTASLSAQDKLMLLAVGREAIRIKYGIFPYNTQILTVLGLLRYPEAFKGRIAQARTGEGKSTIVALLSFYHACQGFAVDVISTSRYLAQRDQDKYAEFFNLFEIATSHLCTDEPSESNFAGLILYGTNYDFEFAWMRDMLGQEHLRRITREGQILPRPLEVVIVDEVDSLFIDSALDSARISISGRSEINWIYQPILDFVKENNELMYCAFIHPQLSKADKGQMIQNEMLESLQRSLCSYQGGKFKHIVEKLKPKKIETWIQSAFSALFEKVRQKDYVIKPIEVRTAEGSSYKDQIVIVDRKNTGRLKEKSRWQNGMHEFLEAKELLPIKDEGLMPAAICHPIYFKNYDKVFGTTGTMGTKEDRKEIQEIYAVDSFDVPPHKKNIRQQLETKVLYSQSDYFQSLLEEAQLMQTQQRPSLFVFETIHETEVFHAFLKRHHIFSQVLNERQVQQEDFVIAKAGAPGMVTIATNTAGRGTDIILHPSSLANGGLHMVFGFFPENGRVKTQGFGRAGRQGQPGSCRLILQFDDPSLTPNEAYAYLKMKRNQRTNHLAKSRKERFAIELINHDYLKMFFAQNQAWQSGVSDSFLERVTTLLNAKLKEIRPDLAASAPAPSLDPQIADLQKAFAYQATHAILSEDAWMPFLKGVRYALQEHIQQEWAELFYTELDELYHQAKTFLPSGKEFERHYKELIEASYLHHHNAWKIYLEDPERGFYQYLSLVCGFPLISAGNSIFDPN